MVYCVYSLESPRWGVILMNTQTHFFFFFGKIKIFPWNVCFLEPSKVFHRDSKKKKKEKKEKKKSSNQPRLWSLWHASLSSFTVYAMKTALDELKTALDELKNFAVYMKDVQEYRQLQNIAYQLHKEEEQTNHTRGCTRPKPKKQSNQCPPPRKSKHNARKNTVSTTIRQRTR